MHDGLDERLLHGVVRVGYARGVQGSGDATLRANA